MTKSTRTLWLAAMYAVFFFLTLFLLISGVLYWIDKFKNT